MSWSTLSIRDQLEMSWGDLLRSIPKRFVALVAKSLGFKSLILGATFIAMVAFDIPTPIFIAWCSFSGAIVLGKEFVEAFKSQYE